MPRVSPLRAFGTRRVEHPFEGKVDTRRRRGLKDIARTLPRAPGVYFFHGFDDRLLYIGKAKCLRERVRSYFAETKQPRPPKLRRLLAEITRLRFQTCGSELEALLVERRLIAEMQPILNRQHKRFKVYPYLLLSDEAFPRLTITRSEPEAVDSDPWPVVSEEEPEEAASAGFEYRPLTTAHRSPELGELPGLYLGPFTTPRHAYWTLEAVRNLFPLRSCEGNLVPRPEHSGCIYGEIGRCCAPCVGRTVQTEYERLCDDLLQLLRTGQAPQIETLKARMTELAAQWRFEEAGELKQQLEAIEIVAARLHRLEQMKACNNVVIVQPGLPAADGREQASLFLVRQGVVRRHLTLRLDEDWQVVKRTLRETYESPLPSASFTAKTELDEMMLLDRWLRAHGQEPCCAWMNDRASRQWATVAVRRLKRSACGNQLTARN